MEQLSLIEPRKSKEVELTIPLAEELREELIALMAKAIAVVHKSKGGTKNDELSI